MDGLLLAVRAVHYGATIVLFGEVVFALLITGRRTPRRGKPLVEGVGHEAKRRFHRVAVGAYWLMIISGACWLAVVTARMNGEPLRAIDASALVTVLGSTVFGQAWLVRTALASVLALLWLLVRTGPPYGDWMAVSAVGIAGGLLAGLAWAGHANAQTGAPGLIHHASDGAHLLAAGVWLGGLAPLGALLGSCTASPAQGAMDRCAAMVGRFGNWAALSVGVLVVTGIANAYYLIPAPDTLFATSYGNILLAKLALFALMLCIAAVNRTRLTRALRASGGDVRARTDAVRILRRNVWVEQALGAGIILLVATLGVTPPAMAM